MKRVIYYLIFAAFFTAQSNAFGDVLSQELAKGTTLNALIEWIMQNTYGPDDKTKAYQTTKNSLAVLFVQRSILYLAMHSRTKHSI